MSHIVKKRNKKEICRHCNSETEIWIIEYHSFGMKSKVYICKNCGKPVNTKNKIHFSSRPSQSKPAFV